MPDPVGNLGVDMNSSSIGAGSPLGAPVKTEWTRDPAASNEPQVEHHEESFGSKLNRMAGVVDTGETKYGPKKDESLSKEAFLKMTMEQIKYQDPMSPVKNEQFTQQMAMLSQLEQQVNMNATLKSLLDNSRNMQIASLQLVGKDITADTGLLYHDGAKASSLQFNLPKNASELKVEILNEEGATIDTIDIGARETGVITTKWDGLTANDVPVPAGKYAYRIVGKGADGKDIPVPTKIEGRVTGVTTSKGATFLLVGEQKVALNDVQSIHESKQSLAAMPGVGNAAGIENVSSRVSGANNFGAAREMALDESAPSKSVSKPQIEVSDDAKSALSEGDSEVSSLFPILYR